MVADTEPPDTFVAVVAVAAAMPRVVHTDYVLMQEDTRLTAYRWVKDTLPPGSRILRFPYTPEFKPSDGMKVRVDWKYELPFEEYKNYDYIITSHYKIIQKLDYEKDTFILINRFSGEELSGFHNPAILIYEVR